MSDRTSATRYARALFDVARQESDPVRVQQDLAAIQAAITGSPELGAVLASRSIPDTARRNVIVAVAEKIGVTAPVAKTLALLSDRGRLELLPDIVQVFGERLLEHQNIVQADVQSAAPLDDETRQALEASLSRATGKQVSMRVTVDPNLRGGIVARVGSTVYDGSVRTQLKKMRDQLVAQG